MGRPRKPTKILELRGAYVKHPERRKDRVGEPEVSTPLGPPPAYLDASEKERWDDVARMAFWATGSDRGVVEIAARLWARMVRREASNADIKQLESAFRCLGCDPVDRTRVVKPNRQPKSKVAKFA